MTGPIPNGWLSRPAKAHRIIDEVCVKHRLPRARVLSYSRKAVPARWEVYWRLRYELRLSTSQVARIVGRDHTTVVHGCQQHERRMEAGP